MQSELEPFSVREALRAHVRETGAKFAVIFMTLVACAAAPVLMGEGARALIFMTIPGLLIVLVLWLRYGVHASYESWRGRRDQYVRELYVQRNGPQQSLDVTYLDRLRFAVLASSNTVSVILTVGVVFGVWVMLFGKFPVGLSVTLGALCYSLFHVLMSAPLGALDLDGELAQHVRANLSYRQAVEGLADLGGGLSAPEARGDGGLSVAVDEGGLEVSEEVALGFDESSSEESVAAHEEHVS